MAGPDFRERLLECLGGPWPGSTDLKPDVVEVTQEPGFRREKLTFEAEPGSSVPAYLLIPDGVSSAKPAPAIAVWHQHNGAWHLGKSEPAGQAGLPMHHTGVALVKLGYVVICIDALCFGERRDTKLDGPQYERFEFLRYVVAGKSLAWKHILDMRRAIDYLVSRPEVDGNRIGCYGHSMGSTHTWMLGPWEPRIRCFVGNCCLPTYAAIERTHLLHCFPNFVPGLAQYGDTPDIASLIAPRPLMLNFGEHDIGSPIEEVRTGIRTIQAAYDSVHASDNFSPFIEAGVGHELTPTMWQRVQDWFGRHLG